MSTVRRSSRLAAKQETVPLTVRVAKPKVKNIGLEDDQKQIPKLVDYDSDDSERTVSDIVKPTEATKPVVEIKKEIVKDIQAPVSDIKKENTYSMKACNTCKCKMCQAVKMTEYPMSPLEPEVQVKKDDVAPSPNPSVPVPAAKPAVPVTAAKPASIPDYMFYIINNKVVSNECTICKRTTIINTIKNYLKNIENSIGNFKISLIMDLFEYIDKNFDYINTEEFDYKKKLILTIHTKTVSLQKELDDKIKNTHPNYKNDIAMFNNAKKLLQRIHTKCHLYGISHFLTTDPVYKNFLDTYMENYLTKQ